MRRPRLPREANVLRQAKIIGTGSYLPATVVENEVVAARIGKTPQWIVERTGIRERRLAAPDEATSDLAVAAARRALEAAAIEPAELDLILCATMTPDHVIPSTAALIQRALGGGEVGGFDLQAACSGYVLALTTAMQYVRAGAAERVLVVGAEKMSSVIDPADPGTAMIFGDGAGAAVVVAAEPGEASAYLTSTQHSRGAPELLSIPAGGSRRPASAATVAAGEHWVRMEGREIFKFAVKIFADTISETCARAGIAIEDVDLVVPHQVNIRILDAAAKRHGIPPERVFVNIAEVGNTTAGSVAIALDEALRAGRVERGGTVLLVAFGAGLTWASLLFRY